MERLAHAGETDIVGRNLLPGGFRPSGLGKSGHQHSGNALSFRRSLKMTEIRDRTF